DMREAPSVDIARQLIAGGASVAAYDPAAMERARPLLPEVRFENDPYALADGAHGLILVTEWNEFKQLDLARIKGLLREPVLVDGRNLYDPADMRRLGFVYRAVGRN
ncbi:MAG: UDP binding domain-containing protein, partial [Candidatus Dormibacteraceae bacterium]